MKNQKYELLKTIQKLTTYNSLVTYSDIANELPGCPPESELIYLEHDKCITYGYKQEHDQAIKIYRLLPKGMDYIEVIESDRKRDSLTKLSFIFTIISAIAAVIAAVAAVLTLLA